MVLAPTLGVLSIFAGCGDGPPEPFPLDEAAYREQVEAWRARRRAELEAPGSWLSLIGLHWLSEGETTLGAAPDNDIVLPEGKAAPRVGTLRKEGDRVVFRAEPGVRVTRGVDSTLTLPVASGAVPPGPVEDPAITDAELTEDVGPGRFVILRHGPLSWIVIRRGDRMALRVRDNTSEVYDRFHGIESYPADPAWRLTARWVPHEKLVPVPNVLGTVAEQDSPAALEFWVHGVRHTLDVTGEPEDGRYMLIFADSTSGRETYGGGRYLWIDPPDADGRVLLDFNLAYNPPCVFTPFATCPLPPRDNRLHVAVTAGEKVWGH
ncbi:MAG: DUF1684 domain-containing protein [Gemmatimonadota bacterium]